MQKIFQTVELCFAKALALLETLEDHLQEWRKSLCDSVIFKAKLLCEEMNVTIEKRTRRKRKMPGEIADDAALDTYQVTKCFLIEILDKLTVEVSNRFSSMREMKERFGFLCTFENYLVDDRKVRNENLVMIEESCNSLAQVYSNDLNAEELFNDIKDIIVLLKVAKRNGEQLDLTPKGILLFITSFGLEAYKTLATALKILLTLPLSVASCERSFSKLNIIKSYLRSTMSQERLSNLAILSIENEAALFLDYDDIIDEFAKAKSRKVQF